MVKVSTRDSFRKVLNDQDPAPIIQEGLQEDGNAQNDVYVNLTVFSHNNIWSKLSESVNGLLEIIVVDKELTKPNTKWTIISGLTEREISKGFTTRMPILNATETLWSPNLTNNPILADYLSCESLFLCYLINIISLWSILTILSPCHLTHTQVRWTRCSKEET